MAMRSLRILALLPTFAACSYAMTSNPPEDGTFEGCSLISEQEEINFQPSVRSFFMNEVGANVDDVVLKKASNCKDNYVFPIDAVAEGMPFPWTWYVFLEKPNGNMSLVRPE